MTFATQRRSLLALLALATPWPLAFNQTLEWGWVLAFAVATLGAWRWNSAGGRGGLLPNWAANALGLAYLAFLWLDLTALSRGQIVRCMTHALVFALALRLFRIERERDAWTTLLGVFVLFLAAMGTSTHPSIVGYLLAWLTLAILLLTRFATFHLFAEFGVRNTPAPPLKLRGLAAGMALVSAALAIPLWIALPRLSTPMVAAAGSGGGWSVPELIDWMNRSRGAACIRPLCHMPDATITSAPPANRSRSARSRTSHLAMPVFSASNSLFI